MRLGTLLLRDAVITLTQLEQSLRAQVLSGGLLGTNLVELGFVDLNTVGRYLARIRDTPLAIADHFEKAEPNLIEAFGAEMADRYASLPLRFESGQPDVVSVVMRDPQDMEAVTQIREHLAAALSIPGIKVKSFIAPELRIFYYLERYYSIRRRTRFTRSPQGGGSPPNSRRERRSTQPFRGLGQPSVVNIVPKKRTELQVPTPAPVLPGIVTSFEQACAAIDAAPHRNHIAESIMQFSIGRFACAAVFMVRAGHAIGWLAQAPGLGAGALERLNLSLEPASIFQAAHDSQKPYRGPALTPGAPLESEVWKLLAVEDTPTDLHVIPVCISDRVVNLIYAHAPMGTNTSEDHADELASLGESSRRAYQRMIDTKSEH